ncbi:hypothetical protein C5167_004160 [Papaver somniferum]|nr:hypothetical protein C5167_004160 [Papaver somniferum]
MSLQVVLALFLVSLRHVVVFSYDSSSSLIHRKQLPAVREEVESLLIWKSTLKNQTHSLLRSWKRSSNSNTTSPCKWDGITCNSEGSVTELNLTSSNLQGYIPQEIGKLSSLIELTLSTNDLVGPIPTSITKLSKLDTLYLYENKLSGTIPQDIGRLTSLTDLELSTNNFTGPIPASICNLSGLNTLYLFQNKLSGYIPHDIGNLGSLVDLELNMNNLNGPIPSSICNLSNLDILLLHQNQLSGQIPQEIGRLGSLTNLMLSSNNLTGSIPGSLCNISNLNMLYLFNNQLSGTIPEEIGKLSLVTDVGLWKNYLTGPIPSSLSNLTNLIKLNIYENQFSGTIPQDIGRLRSLTYFALSTNNFVGSDSFFYAFNDAPFDALKNNSGLCGNHSGGFQLCDSSVMNARKKAKPRLVLIILVSLFGSLFLLFIFLVIFFRLRKRQVGNLEQVDQPTDTKPKGNIFSVQNYDGKLVFEEIIAATENFDTKYCIGEGGYGSVYKVDLSTGQVVAVKKLHSSDEDSEIVDLKSFENEVHALTEIRHKNIVNLSKMKCRATNLIFGL